ncbi:DUF1996 domain-containing protein [Streptomyces sp. JJ36]|uniref:DUF1996 domain-containing protein n=1 Tax=Streptomyces sp. JJ36 TaxID=2736645 RepID=UPI001F34C539|nr:DUF1996 domain-containing protein [Streptomyces sp. JJ36]MCF6523852.1 DUF1996 domain-containing protein [Streptomyces sp. JJ36]
MRAQPARHQRRSRKGIAMLAALLLGGSGIAVVTANAMAGQGSQGDDRDGTVGRTATVQTIDCPDVALAMEEVPQQAEEEVARSSAELDRRVTEAFWQLNRGESARTVVPRLEQQRQTLIDRIRVLLDRLEAQQPAGLDSMDECEVREVEGTPVDDGQNGDDGQDGQEQGGDGQDGQDGDGQEQDGGGQDGQDGDGEEQATGPVAEDFVDITTVEPNVQEPQEQEGASTGTFTSECGVNEEEHFNTDNVIVAPGQLNGAQHTHDHVGNLETDFDSDNDVLAQGETTCTNGDQSTYYWPVLRALDGQEDNRGTPDGFGNQGNVGTILQAKEVDITFEGSPVGDVVAMPRFLQIITGDAKAFTNGPENANASWSCTGFEDRQLTDKYPICPEGSDITRTFRFQSCWDGENIDSANSRDHMAFAEEDGSCPDGFVAVPQLVQKLTYEVPEGENIPEETPFAVDGFAEQLKKPVTDHSDFINVMPEELMEEAVDCINSGQDCS